MSEIIRYARIGKEDVNFGTGTFEVRLADGRVVTLQQVDLGELLSDASISTRDVTLDSLTVATLTVSGTVTPTGTLRIPEKADPGSPVSGEVWINSGATVPEYADDAATPTKHALVGDDTTQTLTNKTLTTPSLTTPVLSGTVTGTYALGGTPSLAVSLDAASQDVTSLDELHFADAAANPTTAGRLRRNGADIVWNDGTTAKIIVLRDAIQTLTNKTLDQPVIVGSGGTLTLPAGPDTLVGKATTDTFTNKTIDAQGTGNSITNISTSALKTSTGSASGDAFGSQDNITMNDYAFSPNVQSTSNSSTLIMQGFNGADSSATVGRFGLLSATNPDNYVVRWRYVTASDNPTIWVLRRLSDGTIKSIWVSDDPLPDNVPGITSVGCESILLKSADLEQFSALSAKASEAQAYIRDRKLKMQHQAYRALQLLANDPAPAQWLLQNCQLKNGRLEAKA